MINIRDKGQGGEREIAQMLNGIIYQVCESFGMTEEECGRALTTVQRNQNQSAVGGNDLTNCFGISIEVKRQESLAVNTWWAQCTAAAARNNELPVLMWRQNRKPWQVRTYAVLPAPGRVPNPKWVVVQFDIDTFKAWFFDWVAAQIKRGWDIRT